MIREAIIYVSVFIGLFGVTFYLLSLFLDKPKKIREFDPKLAQFVTVIIPAWNEERGIAKTIESVLEIDYPKEKFEVIIVDDGSTDNTFKVASKYKSNRVRIYKLEKNSGKGEALNFGIKKAKGEIIVTTDADRLYIRKDALKYMVVYFDDPNVMCVAPIISVYKAKRVLERVQEIEYYLGVLLREAFSKVNAIHITPGAFSAYRKSFFEKYGGFRRAYLTEDLEMALRIQSNHFVIANSTKSVVYTVVPETFDAILKQRRRWYTGLVKNLSDYSGLFSRKYGVLGTIVLPLAVLTIILSVMLAVYTVVRGIYDSYKNFLLLQSVNFNIFSNFRYNSYIIQRLIFDFFSDPVNIFSIVFFVLLLGYMIFAKRKMKEKFDVKVSIVFFFLLYSWLFAYWWIVSFFYTMFNKKVSWR